MYILTETHMKLWYANVMTNPNDCQSLKLAKLASWLVTNRTPYNAARWNENMRSNVRKHQSWKNDKTLGNSKWRVRETMRSSNKLYFKLTETTFDQKVFSNATMEKRIKVQSSAERWWSQYSMQNIKTDHYIKQKVKADQHLKQKVKVDQCPKQKQRTIHIFVHGELFALIFCTADDKASSPRNVSTQVHAATVSDVVRAKIWAKITDRQCPQTDNRQG